MAFHTQLRIAALCLTTCLAACDTADSPQPRTLTFVDDVQPIINQYCVGCHVPGQEGYEKSELLLDSYEGLMKGTRFGRVVEPGSAETSSLYLLVSGKGRLLLTMPHGKDYLSNDEVRIIRAWIDRGAVEQ